MTFSKLLIRSSLLVLLSFCLILISCKKDDNVTGATGTPIDTNVTAVNANGSIAPVSRTEVQGTMFVTDQNGSPISGITSQNVSPVLRWTITTPDSVYGTPTVQTISQAGKNIAVAMTMDYSGSMYVGDWDTAAQRYKRILDMENAVKAFVNAMQPGDIAEIIKFGDNSLVEVVQPFTSDKNLLLKAADSASYSRGFTALYKSIYQSLNDAALQSSANYARAVVAFTDGGENDSYPITRDSIFEKSFAYAIPVYTVGLLDSFYHSDPPGQNSSQELDLVQIADSTGGFYFYAPDAAQLIQIYSRISGQISNAYTITVTWPSSGLPPTGTPVTAIIGIQYNNLKSQFTRNYTMP